MQIFDHKNILSILAPVAFARELLPIYESSIPFSRIYSYSHLRKAGYSYTSVLGKKF